MLNEYILMLWEEFMKGDIIEFKGRYETPTGSQKIYDVTITGKDIAGWYKNRIKWPSAIRTDDPVYVQNHLQQLQAQPFPAISLYTYLEEMGFEDVEAEIDRIGLQLEDPRFHPDRMESAVNSMTQLQGAQIPGMPSAQDALAPEGALMGDEYGGQDAEQQAALVAAGNPDQRVLAATRT